MLLHFYLLSIGVVGLAGVLLHFLLDLLEATLADFQRCKLDGAVDVLLLDLGESNSAY